MTAANNGRYRRRFLDPAAWPSNQAFADRAVEATRQRVNELSWGLLAEQVAANASAWLDAPGVGDEVESALRAETARLERHAAALAEGWTAGEPGE